MVADDCWCSWSPGAEREGGSGGMAGAENNRRKEKMCKARYPDELLKVTVCKGGHSYEGW